MQGKLVRHVGNAVAHLLHPARSIGTAMRMGRHSLARKRRPTGAQSETEFLERLKATIQRNGGAAQAGRITVLGLDRLKEKLSDRWDELRDRVQTVCRSALQKCLQPDDIWVASGDKFVIAFGSLSIDEAQTKCRMIARIIETALLGDATTETITVAAAVATVDGHLTFRDLPALETMIARSCTIYAGVPRQPHDTGSRAQAPTAPAPAAQPRDGQAPAPGEPAGAAGKSIEIVALEDEPPPGREMGWEPVWDTKMQRITLYRARHIDDQAAAHARLLDEGAVSEIDLALRDSVIDQLKTCVGEARVAALALPVRFSTMASWSRRRTYIAGLAQSISPELRKALLIILCDVPDGVPPSRLVELVAAVRPFCREVIVEGPSQAVDLAALAAARVFAVGKDFSGQIAREALLMLRLDQFAASAKKARVANTCLAGANSLPLVTAAVGAGFRYISGSAIRGIDENIGGGSCLTLDDLYRRYIESRGLTWPGGGGEALRWTA